ncbi:MAG: cytochrome bc1 complex diheme cytochrome c subunit [Propionibacteriaceae bacterium]
MSERTLRRRTRRSPLRRAALIGAALVVMGGISAVAAPTVSNASPLPTEVGTGQQLFIKNCSSCHGLNAQGVTVNGTVIGPNIQNAGAAAVSFQMSSGRMPMAGQQQQSRRTTNTFSADEIKAVAEYVGALGNGPGLPTSSQYDTTGLTAEEIAKGGELFRTNCSACHNYAGKGGALSNGNYAPPLTGTGVTNQEIWEAVRTGPQNMPVFSPTQLSDEDARSIIAYLSDVNSAPDSGYSLGGVGPVTEGAAAWIVGIGSLVGFALWIASRGARAR